MRRHGGCGQLLEPPDGFGFPWVGGGWMRCAEKTPRGRGRGSRVAGVTAGWVKGGDSWSDRTIQKAELTVSLAWLRGGN